MKQFQIGSEAPSIASLTIGEGPSRAPEGDEIRVRIEASSLNFHDYLVVTGLIPVRPGTIPLSDGVGIVEACGPAVRRFAAGDRVMGTFFPDWHDGPATADKVARMRGDHVDGFAAEYVTLSETQFTMAPATLSAREAACLPCAGLTAWRAVMVEGQIKPGDTVLVQGSGGVSVFAMQLARLAGAQVIATSSSQEKADRLKALGASAVIDRNAEPGWGKAARRLTSDGVDLVVEVGGGDLTQSLQALRTGGRLCLVGALSRRPFQFPAMEMIHANRVITGVTVGSRAHQADLVRAVDTGGLRPVVDSVFPFANLADAFAHLESQRHFGKIVVAWD